MKGAVRLAAWLRRLGPAVVAALLCCAPPRVPSPILSPESRRERFERALARRETRAAGVEAELSLWARSGSAHDLPGAQARLLIAAPDAFRLRVASAFAVALDLAACGDTLEAFVPRERLGMRIAAAGDSLGVADPGALGCRAWCATWRPPERAWERAQPADSLLRLGWREGPDSLALEVGSNGLPVSVSLSAASRGGATVVTRYRSWEALEGVVWPVVLEIEDAAGGLGLTARIHRLRPMRRPSRERLRVAIPPDADWLTAGELKDVIERLGRP